MPNFDTIIFDLDGTLADTAEDVRYCANITLREMGLSEINLEQAKRAIGPGPDNFARITLPLDRQDLYPEFIQRFRAYYAQHYLRQTRLFPGVPELLERLNGHKLVVATNKPLGFSRQILTGLGILQRFQLVIGPEEVTQLKPHPEMIEKAIERVGGTKEKTLMVGDTDNDVRSAKAAGVKICAVTYGYSPAEVLRQEKPDYMIDHPRQLLSILDEA